MAFFVHCTVFERARNLGVESCCARAKFFILMRLLIAVLCNF